MLEAVKRIAREAGEAILEVYERGPAEVSLKADDSPLTEADLAAQRVIAAGLGALQPALPLLSEESAAAPWRERARWRRYWLVDPLDGTKEFLGRNGEFTVNIALVEDGAPVLGVVFAPALDLLYWGAAGQGAWRQQGREAPQAVHSAPLREGAPLRVVASRRHGGEAVDAWLAALARRFPEPELLSMGSSLKICLVAEGRADIYPRLAPTCEWDTAAAQAVLEAAGGSLTDTRLAPFRYNRKEALLNPFFYAIGDPGYPWAEVLPAS